MRFMIIRKADDTTEAGGLPDEAILDGPFTETKELVAGYCLLETKSPEEALDWAKRWPPIDGEVELEIRRLYEADDFGEEFTPELREKEERMRAELAQKT